MHVMNNYINFKPIAYINNEFKSKFAIPRQSGIAKDLISTIVFEPEFRDDNSLRGLDGFSHLWLIWHFSENKKTKWSATVRPPRLGGNIRMGVFATRSPYRPNPIGLSCVKLVDILKAENVGTVLVVSGADLLDKTPIFDIKPYLTFADSIPDAKCGFADEVLKNDVDVLFSDECLATIDSTMQKDIKQILSNNPKPSYHKNDQRIYVADFSDFEIKFKYSKNTIFVLSVTNKSV